jgi:hypothetical protein
LSQTQRQAANEWYDHTLYNRLNDKLSGAIVLIMHRLHEDDLAGHVLTQEPWEVVRIPAIADEDERHPAETVFGRQYFGRRGGEVLHPEREPPEMLEQIRRTLGEYNFAGRYQQAPSPQGGGMVKAAWFRSYAANERPETAVGGHLSGYNPDNKERWTLNFTPPRVWPGKCRSCCRRRNRHRSAIVFSLYCNKSQISL